MFDFQSPAMSDLFFVSPDYPFTDKPLQPEQIKETLEVEGVNSRITYIQGSTEMDG